MLAVEFQGNMETWHSQFNMLIHGNEIQFARVQTEWYIDPNGFEGRKEIMLFTLQIYMKENAHMI